MFRSKQLRCSFCGKRDSEVLKLVAGPRVHICDACVAIATQLMEEPPQDNHLPTVHVSKWHKLLNSARHIIRGGGSQRVGLPMASR